MLVTNIRNNAFRCSKRVSLLWLNQKHSDHLSCRRRSHRVGTCGRRTICLYNDYSWQLHMNISWNAPWTLATNSDTSGLRYGPKCIDILWLEMNQHESAKINLLWNIDMGSHFVASSKSNSKMLIRLEKPFHLALLAVWCLIRPRGDSMT